MLRQATNNIYIEGILAENDLNYVSYNKDGKTLEAISGKVIIKVNQKISSKDKELMIPIHIFAPKYKKDGNLNPSFTSMENVKNNMTSIAAGGIDAADRVRCTAALEMNEYYSQDERLISFPRVKTSFINKINADQCVMKAEGQVEFCVAEKIEEIENDEPTGRMIIRGIVPQYGGKVDVIPFYVETPQALDVANTYWNESDTVRVKVKLNFSTITKEIVEEADFGEPTVRTKTINVSEIVIAGGNAAPLDGDLAFQTGDIQNALAERKSRLEAQKVKDLAKSKTKSAPVQSKKLDLGF